MQKVLILGSQGNLGTELVEVFSKNDNYQVTGWSRDDVDITNYEKVEEMIKEIQPEIIINAIAYNQVDLCEKNEEEYKKAIKLNTEVPTFLSKLSKEINSLFVHYSTDYVFGSNNEITGGFTENTTPIPGCKYAETKYQGELNAQKENEDIYIIRLSRLFGKETKSINRKKSFFEIMFNVGKTKDEVQVVDDEISCFTYAPDLAQASKDIIESKDKYGIYHLVNEGEVAWHDGVIELYKQTNLKTKIIGVSGTNFARDAKRPNFSVLKNTKRPPLRNYKEALEEYIKYIEQKNE